MKKDKNLTPDQLFQQKQAEMSNEVLLGKVEKLIMDNCQKPNSWRMSVPPNASDHDMLLSELVRRYKELLMENDIQKNTVKQTT